MPILPDIRLHTAGLLLAIAAPLPVAAVAAPAFAPRSVLARGQWVRVGVDRTGVYELSYDELRQMGFADPARVSVYGRGGRMQPVSFVSGAGEILYEDDLSPVSVLHRDGKVYFYGEGVEHFEFKPDQDRYPTTMGYFVNQGRNIYSSRGYYFLTDSRARPLTMALSDVGESLRPDAFTVYAGVGLAWHEQDIEQNHSGSGQLFWGESFAVSSPEEQRTHTFPVTLPGLADETGVMECVYYSDRSVYKLNPWIRYGMAGSDRTGLISVRDSGPLEYAPQKDDVSEVGLTGDRGEIVVTGCSRTDGVANLDYWSVTYPRLFPTLRMADGTRLAQDMVTFPYFFKGDVLRFEPEEPQGCLMLDVTDPRHPVLLPVTDTTAGHEVYMSVSGDHPSVVVFDTARSQMRISGYTDASAVVANQDLHSLQDEEYDFVIIALPWLMEQAEAIADIHRTEDGMRVAVASSTQVYNEFSGGVPDPMAYRAFVKMLHTASGGRLKNLLLLGPLYSDIRGLAVERDMEQGLIAYQCAYVSQAKGASNVNDYYGMMADYLPTPFKNPEKETIHVGVGVLPCASPSEAEMYVDKLRRFYDHQRCDAVYTANRRVSIGCPGDGHMHDTQSTDFTRYLENLTPGLLSTDIVINAYGNEKARAKTFEAFNTGAQVFTYYGHGGPDFLTFKSGYFDYCDVGRMRNETLPFMCFAACNLSNTDRGQRGLGEALVLDTPHGLIASLVATRETWSKENQLLMEQVNKSLSRAEGTLTGGWLRYPRTLGETVAQAKSITKYSNSLSYLLIGDPAITIPAVLRGLGTEEATGEIRPGEDTEIGLRGFVAFRNGTRDTGFNGTAVVRLLEPAVIEVSADVVEAETTTLDVTYADRQILMATAEVREGRFSVSLPVTGGVARFAGSSLILNVTAYDPSTRTVMAATREIPVSGSADDFAAVADDRAPVIESIVYDPVCSMLRVVASDDVALNLSQGGIEPGLRLHLDGAYRREGAQASIKAVDEGSMRVERDIPLGSLGHGTHVARVEVTDAAGNFAVSELSFEVGAPDGRFSLAMDETALTDSVTFRLSGDIPAAALLMVTDTAGRPVFSAPVTGAETVWDGRDDRSVRVAPGRYKACVVETGAHMSKGHSNTVDVPVI